ncbi:MAG: hypothetical protein HRK26_03420 [Rickettsiaceae bacterium H1]|nr:hypothetical protein [Rickettsiaceae bacterium H1]
MKLLSKKTFTFLYTLLLLAGIGMLFGIKYNVANLQKQLSNIENEIDEIQNTIKIIEAEWSYLTQPARLEKLAEKYLKLEPILYSQVHSDLDTKYTVLASLD